MDKDKSKERFSTSERIFWIEFAFILIFIIADLIVYRYSGVKLIGPDQSSFFGWLMVLLSPHNWLAIATTLIPIHMIYRLWIFIEDKKCPIIKKYRFIPLAIILLVVLILIGLFF